MTLQPEKLLDSRKCLILSNGPVPTPEHKAVEGGGLRCWGLAKGIKQNEPGIEVTVAYHQGHQNKDFTALYESILLTTWTNETVHELIKDFDTIVVSYCMGDLSVIVANNIRPDQQLVLDCYVPIYVEVSARGSKDVEREYHAFNSDVPRWGEVLKRGDLFLCASEPQKRYYQGVLSALGRINPVTYGKETILIVPYGIYRDKPVAKSKPITKLINDTKFKKVLWFGGIYPWFDLRNLVDAVRITNEKIPTKLVIVGAKNPYNTHPDFLKSYDDLMQYIDSDVELKNIVVVQEWIKFEDRADWYLDSDCVVVINKEGPENELAWRTRLVDFIWADLPIISNGGDPLGEILIQNGAALRFSGIGKNEISSDLIKFLKNDESKSLHKQLNKIRSNYYWDTVTEDLAVDISSHKRASDLEQFGLFSVASSQLRSQPKIKRAFNKAKKVPAYASKYGYKTTTMVISEMVRRKISSRGAPVSNRRKPAYVFVSHQLDMSGGPFIAIDMAIDFHKAGKPVEFYTYLPAHQDNITKLNKAGIKPRILMNKDMIPSFINGDTILLNTVAHSETVKEALFGSAEQSLIKQIIWYIHEDDPQMLFRPDEAKRIKKMLANDQMKILIAADKMLQNYTKHFGTSKNIVKQTYRHVVPKKYHHQRPPSDFTDKLSFVLPGTVGDGRKGQLPIFYAFCQFYEQYYKVNKSDYRDFELVFVGMSDDFLSRQIKSHANALKGHFKMHDKVTWTENIEIVNECNITVCYSIRECLPLFVFEGMVAGHPILRNDSSGIDEQLEIGKNGYYLDSNDYNQVVTTIEKILNKNKTSDKLLSSMSKRSNEIAAKQAENSYLDCVGD